MPTVIKPKDAVIGDIVSGTVYGGTIANFNNVTIVGIVSGGAVRDASAAAISHANVFPSIPPELDIIDDYTSYDFFIFRRADNTTFEMGVPWIDVNSLTRSDRARLVVEIVDFDSNRLTELKDMLEIRSFGRSFTTKTVYQH